MELNSINCLTMKQQLERFQLKRNLAFETRHFELGNATQMELGQFKIKLSDRKRTFSSTIRFFQVNIDLIEQWNFELKHNRFKSKHGTPSVQIERKCVKLNVCL